MDSVLMTTTKCYIKLCINVMKLTIYKDVLINLKNIFIRSSFKKHFQFVRILALQLNLSSGDLLQCQDLGSWPKPTPSLHFQLETNILFPPCRIQ